MKNYGKNFFRKIDDVYKTVYHESLQGNALSRFLQNDVNTRNFRIFDRFLKRPDKDGMVIGRTTALEHADDHKIKLSFGMYSNQTETYIVSTTLLSKILWQWARALAEKPYSIEISIDWDAEMVKTTINRGMLHQLR
jgi:hypothetical protein